MALTGKQKLLYICSLTSFISITFAFGRNVFVIISPEIVADLGISYEFLGRINALHQALYLIFALLGGLLARRIGARLLVLLSVGLCAASVLLLAFVNNPWLLMAVVGFQGIFAAASWIPMVEMVSYTIEERSRGKSLGIISGGTSYGLVLTGLFIPRILAAHHWHTVWLVFGILSFLVGAAGIWIVLRTPVPVARDRPADTAAADSAVPGAVRGRRRGWIQMGVMVLSGLYLIPYQSYLSAYIVDDLKLGSDLAGLCWGILGFVGIFSGIVTGMLADRLSAKRAMVITYTLIIASMAAAWLARGPVMMILSSTLFAATYNGVFALHPTYVSRTMPPDQTAAMFGVLNLSLGLGSMVGNYGGGAIKEATGSFSPAFFLMLVLSVVTMGASLLLRDDASVPAQEGESIIQPGGKQ